MTNELTYEQGYADGFGRRWNVGPSYTGPMAEAPAYNQGYSAGMWDMVEADAKAERQRKGREYRAKVKARKAVTA